MDFLDLLMGNDAAAPLRPTRRRALHATLAALAAASLPRAARAQRAPERVIVIGAGMAGIAAARQLIAAGEQVIVLEARQRVGGRIHTFRDWGVPIELGATWIHGARGNPISGLAHDLGIDVTPARHGVMRLYPPDGPPLPEAEVSAVRRALRRLMRNVEDHPSLPVGQAMDRVVAQELSTPADFRAYRWARSLATLITAAELDRLAVQGLDDDLAYPGGDRRLVGGYDQLPLSLARPLDVRLGEGVRRIALHGDVVSVDTAQARYVADRVVVTLPLGVLQAGTVRFDPAPLALRQRAVDRLGVGVLEKIALRFAAPFWPSDRHRIGYMSDIEGEFPLFSAISRTPPILVAWVAGDFARGLHLLDDAAVVDHVTSILRRILGSSASAPIALHRSRWALDPASRGAYSHVAMGAQSADYDALAAPIGDRIFFAGEATTRAWRATVHGAWTSGLRAAEQVLLAQR